MLCTDVHTVRSKPVTQCSDANAACRQPAYFLASVSLKERNSSRDPSTQTKLLQLVDTRLLPSLRKKILLDKFSQKIIGPPSMESVTVLALNIYVYL